MGFAVFISFLFFSILRQTSIHACRLSGPIIKEQLYSYPRLDSLANRVLRLIASIVQKAAVGAQPRVATDTTEEHTRMN
jgi:hypothetical protein